MARIKVNTGIPTKKVPLIIIIITALYSNLTEFASLVVGIPVSGAMFKAQIDELLELIAASKGGDHSATLDIATLILKIRANFKLDALFLEEQINTTSPPSLATKLGFILSKIKGKMQIVTLRVFNTPVLGRVAIIIGGVPKAYFYKVEYYLISADGTPGVTLTQDFTNVTGSIENLVSGGKYAFRVRTLFKNNVVGEWSDYVQLRVS